MYFLQKTEILIALFFVPVSLHAANHCLQDHLDQKIFEETRLRSEKVQSAKYRLSQMTAPLSDHAVEAEVCAVFKNAKCTFFSKGGVGKLFEVKKDGEESFLVKVIVHSDTSQAVESNKEVLKEISEHPLSKTSRLLEPVQTKELKDRPDWIAFKKVN